MGRGDACGLLLVPEAGSAGSRSPAECKETQVPPLTVSTSPLDSDFIFLVVMLLIFALWLYPIANTINFDYCVLIPPIDRTVPMSMMENSSIYTMNLYTNSMLPDEIAICLL